MSVSVDECWCRGEGKLLEQVGKCVTWGSHLLDGLLASLLLLLSG